MVRLRSILEHWGSFVDLLINGQVTLFVSCTSLIIRERNDGSLIKHPASFSLDFKFWLVSLIIFSSCLYLNLIPLQLNLYYVLLQSYL